MANNDCWQWGIYLAVFGSLAIVVILLLLLRWYIIRPMYNGKARMDGKNIVITGANTGIGKETALDLSKRGGRVIILCRDMVKAQAVVNEISNEANTTIELYHLDLSSLESVRTCAEIVKARVPKIDVLINNAGVAMAPEGGTTDGFEMHLGINHLGHFLLTLLLIDNLKASAPSRIINVSSLAHMNGKMHWDDLHLKNNYSGIKAYSQSKLANILFTRSLAQKLEGTGVTSYALHPGVVKTEIGRHLGWKVVFLNMVALFYKSPSQGAQTSIYCAVEPSLENESGKYYSGCAPKRPTSRARSDEDAERLWRWSLDSVGLPQTFTI